MKDIVSVLLVVAIPIGCFSIAAYLAANGLDGWGWFLFAGLICTPTRIKTGEDAK